MKNSVRLTFVKKNCMLNLKSLSFVNTYSLSCTRYVKRISHCIICYIQHICSWKEDLKPYQKSEKRPFHRFCQQRKKSFQDVGFSHRPLHNILKIIDHRRDLSTFFWKQNSFKKVSSDVWRLRLTVVEDHYWNITRTRWLRWIKSKCDF